MKAQLQSWSRVGVGDMTKIFHNGTPFISKEQTGGIISNNFLIMIKLTFLMTQSFGKMCIRECLILGNWKTKVWLEFPFFFLLLTPFHILMVSAVFTKHNLNPF